ncbi:MAG: Mrp/NBP35 family ATP-binding protein [Anaerolineae bacterium]|nr:Mrp/NBP35 family ATP-binding protein [Anaerolineae bacterium]
MVTVQQVTDALRNVMDPELGKNIVELGMVRDVAITGHVVSFTFALTTLACPLRGKMVEEAKAEIAKLDERLELDVQLAEMTEEEKQRLVQGDREKPLAERLNEIGHAVAVMSGKGGVGKSSVAALLAVALRRQGKRVGVLDADITGPSIPMMFGLHDRPTVSPIGLLPAETRTGIKVMSINLLLQSEEQAVIWRGPLISGAIRQFWSEVFWRDLDYLVIDLPPGTSDASLTVMQSIPLNGVVMVTSPQDLAGMVVRKAAQMAMQLNVPVLGLVENMSYVTCPKCGERIDAFGPTQAPQTARYIGAPLLGRLPIDPELAQHCDAGTIEAYPATAFKAVAAHVTSLMPAAKVKPVFE